MSVSCLVHPFGRTAISGYLQNSGLIVVECVGRRAKSRLLVGGGTESSPVVGMRLLRSGNSRHEVRINANISRAQSGHSFSALVSNWISFYARGPVSKWSLHSNIQKHSVYFGKFSTVDRGKSTIWFVHSVDVSSAVTAVSFYWKLRNLQAGVRAAGQGAAGETARASFGSVSDASVWPWQGSAETVAVASARPGLRECPENSRNRILRCDWWANR